MAKRKQKSGGLVRRFVSEIGDITRRANQSLSDEEMDEVCERLLSLSSDLINAPA